MQKQNSRFQKILSLTLVLSIVLGLGLFSVESAHAGAPIGGTPAALNAAWSVSITYQNTGDADTNVVANFYEEGSSSPTAFDPRDGKGPLGAGAADSFAIGEVALPAGFSGNAVLSAQEPLAATSVQYSSSIYSYNGGSQAYNMRLLTNAFSATDVSSQYLIATTLLNKFNRTTKFAIQNTTGDEIDATVRFYDADNEGALESTKVFSIPGNSSKLIEMNNVDDTGINKASFNGSAIVSAVKKGTNTESPVVAAAVEYYVDRPVATAFEGTPLSAAAKKINMATALCEKFGLDTFYAIQNASLTDEANVLITYLNTNGTTKATDGPYNLKKGSKKSVHACTPSDGTNMSGFTGSAVITVESGAADIVAIGKAQNSINAGSEGTSDVLTAFMGQAFGYAKLSLPFVRWSTDDNFFSPTNNGGKQRTYIAVQNLEDSQIKVNVSYNDKDGNSVATQVLTIDGLSKGNTNADEAGALGKNGMNPGEFGYYPGNIFGGGVIVEPHPDNAGAKIIAIARGQNPGAGEDYNGICVDTSNDKCGQVSQ